MNSLVAGVSMDNKVKLALKRLDNILPLLDGLKSLGREDARLYCRLLGAYVEKGRALRRDELSGIVADPARSLEHIADSKLILLDPQGNPAGAYPFTSQQREHRVSINGVTAHCMCALDALAVSPMFDQPGIIDSECRVTGNSIHIEQDGTRFSDGTVDAWFGINWGAAAGDIACAESLCLEMIFLANRQVARQWLAESPDTQEIFDLQSAVQFAAAFFVPLADYCKDQLS